MVVSAARVLLSTSSPRVIVARLRNWNSTITQLSKRCPATLPTWFKLFESLCEKKTTEKRKKEDLINITIKKEKNSRKFKNCRGKPSHNPKKNKFLSKKIRSSQSRDLPALRKVHARKIDSKQEETNRKILCSLLCVWVLEGVRTKVSYHCGVAAGFLKTWNIKEFFPFHSGFGVFKAEFLWLVNLLKALSELSFVVFEIHVEIIWTGKTFL